MFLKGEPTIHQGSVLAVVCGEAFDRFLALVRAEGLEPPRLASQVPKTCVSTSSTTPAVRKAAAGEGAQLYPFDHPCQSHCDGPCVASRAAFRAFAPASRTGPLGRLAAKRTPPISGVIRRQWSNKGPDRARVHPLSKALVADDVATLPLAR